MAGTIQMPNNWDCYDHQKPLWNYLDNGGKRAVAVWHRRGGKDSTVLNYSATESIDKVGTYYHMLPTQRQAKKVIWDGIDRDGRRMIDQAFPKQLRAGINKQEMQIEQKNGSIWQLCGSDNYDSLVGSNPKGVVFSEWALCNPSAWDYIRPILAENNGWAVFIYTARGKNHGWTLSEMARKNPKWFHSVLTVDDTYRPDGSRIITPEAIQDERDAGMSEDMIQQEFHCSFDVAIRGAYFATELASARADGRIGFVPIEPMIDVHTFWDLGISKGNAMNIWFVQAIGKEIRIINHYEAEGQGMPHFSQYLDKFKKDHNINYGVHHAPHDINVRELTSGKRRIDTLRDMGMKFVLVPRTSDLNDSIETTRRLIARCWFDETRCSNGISALASYHRKYDESNACFLDQPVHDWASNPADAFRQMAQAWSDRLVLGKRNQFSRTVQADISFSVFD
jgi:hypothetical protein